MRSMTSSALPAMGLSDRIAAVDLTRRQLGAAGVAFAIGTSAVVFSEPAPTDLVMMALIPALPLLGLVRVTPALLAYLALWLVCGAGAVVAATFSQDVSRSSVHSAVSIYLYLASFVLAGYIAADPVRRTELVLRAYVVAAGVAAAAALAGYFALVPWAYDLFTKFGRASGTFKDPNVLGPFLVPAVLYLVHRAVSEPAQKMAGPLAMALVLVVVVVLSFSRGAWLNLAVALLVFGYLHFVTARSDRHRLRLVVLAFTGLVAIAAIIVVALQFDGVGRLLAERASLTQSYDVGPDGRFGGHDKARALLLENPLGIGALQFAARFHHEDVHNAYLNMFLSAGWIGGLLFIIILVGTMLLALRHAIGRAEVSPLFLIAVAALAGNVVEGFVIDIDHWRHLYLLLAVAWGFMTARTGERASG
ncbi:MAG TPA: hypothetical protein PK264_11985 [Hyphomicrobiaceae bacterium]|nr:hypothetical protein [Hyphomicrobiaceae bacterium]